MLVIISDLHLVDGTTGCTVSPGAFELLAERLEQLARCASHRADGSYRPIPHLDVLLLGDVLDVTRSSRWLTDGQIRPWDDSRGTDFVQTVTNITSDILRHNDRSLDVLRSLSQEGTVTVPPADGRQRPIDAAPGVPVSVRIHYMVGNHDWFYHLPGGEYDVLRRALVDHLGLAHEDCGPFPHEAHENERLRDVLAGHRVLARHGDIFDPLSYEGDRDASSLSDAIVIELIDRFAIEVGRQLADDLPVATLRGLREIDDVRPLLLVPVWLDGLLHHTGAAAHLRRHVMMMWDRLADRFLQLPFVRSRDRWSAADIVNRLDRVLKFSKQGSTTGAATTGGWLEEVAADQRVSLADCALAEHDFRNRRAKHVVYGHTHTAEQVPLDASSADAFVLHQVYFNTGTWRRVVRPTQLNPTGREFLPADTMTYLVFYQADERHGRPYETWSGTLGPYRSAVPVHRIDNARASDATAQPISTPRLRTRAPHFTPSSARSGIVPTRRL